MFITGETVGLAEWIIDDACSVYFVSLILQSGDRWTADMCESSDHYRP